jgi:NADH-quinone oxidoreductase subunit F
MMDGKGQPGDIERLQMQCKFMGPGLTFCALAPGAADPLMSALKYFREDFERAIQPASPAAKPAVRAASGAATVGSA